MPDESPKGRRRTANAKGFKVEEPTKSAATPPAGRIGAVGRNYAGADNAYLPITRTSQFSGYGANVAISQPMFFSPMYTPQNWQIAQRRKEVYQWARFYYENEPKVAAGVDFYAQFPMNGFSLECHVKSVRRYFEELVKNLKLNYWLKLISHEYFLLGDVFPFLSIECKHCSGKGVLESGKTCNHPDGKFKNITILNPDYVEVEDSPFPDHRNIYLIPDEQLKRTVLTKEPRAVYDRIPDAMKGLIATGQKIWLSPRSVSHIKHSECPYGKYGTSILRRLFTVLAYKTKLMTANWIVAERLVLPVRVVKLGEKDRPAGPDDIADMQQQIAAVANDPNLTIVTHHAFDYEWYGATGKIHNITGEMELIGKEILDGLMISQALLNGEMAGYSSAQVGVETLIKRLETWRHALADWVEEHIFKPTAMMQGFIDEAKTKELGKTVYMYPTIKWNDMQLRDKTNKLQMFMQLHDKSLISTELLLQEFDIDYDQEQHRLRKQMIMSSPGGVAGGAGGGMPGGMDGGGGGGGAGGAPPGGAPMDPSGGAGGAPGMGAPGGAPPGGAAPMGGAPMGAAAAGGGSQKVYKKGKGPKESKEEEPQMVAPSFVKLTTLEQKLWGLVQDLKLPFKLYGQFKQQVQGEQQPYVMDFALPEIRVDIESDGEIWHEQEGAKERDAERDKKLAGLGWRVIRFTEDAINEHAEEVKKAIQDNVKQAADEVFSRRKKASVDGTNKFASSDDISEPETVMYALGNSSYDEWSDTRTEEVDEYTGRKWASGRGSLIQVTKGVVNETIQFESDEDRRS
jgi:very-short-patch-repair endonuclease